MIFDDDIRQCLDVLNRGGIIVYPTDTIWGMGCDATNKEAVEKIFQIKSRSESKSLLILVDGETMLERYVAEVPETAWQLLEVSDSPLTIVYPAGKNLADGVCASDGSVGIRICREQFCSELIKRFRKPIVSTSANFSGQSSPENFDSIDRTLLQSVDYVVKYKQNDRERSASSPVIKVDSDGSIKILRK
jgi:L-threonylcarbamoyladenylate synthase